jgi:carbon storage regulator
MLVLTRRTKQSIMIGDEIELSILSVSGEKVRLGIEAPDEVPVFRKEVYLRIQGEHASSNGAGTLELESQAS